MKYFALPLLLALGACASTQEVCIDRAGERLNAIQERIETAEGNISRGYAIHVSEEPRASVGFCTGNGYGGGYHSNIGISTCIGTDNGPREQAVAIDVSEERAKLEQLREAFAQEQVTYQAQVAQCRSAFPD
ncbi:hypothetical protein AYJ57_21455 (plasmid) [Salipiger sp. CCB-MM3]|uniref:hypothetical protein n=1 Tax=Salipiger sp. CCB-MM3 TaxID=1792508 RepID=UPI00080AACAB|nr:hypothetical protein [Salipiger sp. CCB-MM3]ANT63043.1 hypothetical protein AYJ57_21455 [Salipiger sp. CCB-MM3]